MILLVAHLIMGTRGRPSSHELFDDLLLELDDSPDFLSFSSRPNHASRDNVVKLLKPIIHKLALITVLSTVIFLALLLYL